MQLGILHVALQIAGAMGAEALSHTIFALLITSIELCGQSAPEYNPVNFIH